MTSITIRPLSPSSSSLNAIKTHIEPPRKTTFLPSFLRTSTSYVNPWPSDRSPVNASTLSNAFEDPGANPHPEDLAFEAEQGWGQNGEGEKHPVQVRKRADFDAPDRSEGRDVEKISVRGMWVGHASFWLSFATDGTGGQKLGVMFDPVFEKRASPSDHWGPVRDVPPPCPLEDLPPIHLIIISHSHLDHLSQHTSEALLSSPTHGSTVHWLVPLGVKAFFTETIKVPADRVREMDWWEEVSVVLGGEANEIEQGFKPVRLRVACTPSQHSSGRGIGDQDKTLWASWVLGMEADGKSASIPDSSTNTVPPTPSDPFQKENADLTRDDAADHAAGAIHEDKPTYQLATKEELEASHKIWSRMAYKVFFGGDTGYRLYGTDPSEAGSTCPAFKQIATLYFRPSSVSTLLLLPISPGASLPYIKSFNPFSALSSLFHKGDHSKSGGGWGMPEPNMAVLTSTVHMTPADACEVFKLFAGGGTGVRAIGIHWGTWGGPELATKIRRWLWKEMRARGIPRNGDGGFELWKVGTLIHLA